MRGMKHPRTTLLGILTIVATIAGAAVEFLKTGSCNLIALTTGVTVGVGLIKAADSANVQ